MGGVNLRMKDNQGIGATLQLNMGLKKPTNNFSGGKLLTVQEEINNIYYHQGPGTKIVRAS